MNLKKQAKSLLFCCILWFNKNRNSLMFASFWNKITDSLRGTTNDPGGIAKRLKSLLSGSNRAETISFVRRGARSLRLRSLDLKTGSNSKSLVAEVDDWVFTSGQNDTIRLILTVSHWQGGEEIRLEGETDVVEPPSIVPGIVELTIPESMSQTTLEFLTRPDPVKPLTYYFSIDGEEFHAPVLEMSRRSFRFRLPADQDISPDGALNGDGYIRFVDGTSIPFESWWNRIGKLLTEAEIQRIKSKQLEIVIAYLRDRFLAQEVVWDGMHKVDPEDDNEPGIRMRRKSQLGDLKALWLDSDAPPSNWFPGAIEPVQKWTSKSADAIAVEYDAVIGSNRSLVNWIEQNSLSNNFENQCVIIQLGTGQSHALTITSIEKTTDPVDWEALFGWTKRYDYEIEKEAYLVEGSRRDHFRLAQQLTPFNVRLHWITRSKLFPEIGSFIFLPDDYSIATQLIEANKLLIPLVRAWVLGEGGVEWDSIGIAPMPNVEEWAEKFANEQ